MALRDVVKLLDTLSRDELRLLREQIDQREQVQREQELKDMPLNEWIARMEAAADAIRADMTDEEWQAAERAMNEEYIEPVDESEWSD